MSKVELTAKQIEAYRKATANRGRSNKGVSAAALELLQANIDKVVNKGEQPMTRSEMIKAIMEKTGTTEKSAGSAIQAARKKLGLSQTKVASDA